MRHTHLLHKPGQTRGSTDVQSIQTVSQVCGQKRQCRQHEYCAILAPHCATGGIFVQRARKFAPIFRHDGALLGGPVNPSILRRRRENEQPCTSSLSPRMTAATWWGEGPGPRPCPRTDSGSLTRRVRERQGCAVECQCATAVGAQDTGTQTETRRVRRRTRCREPRIPHVSLPARAQAASTPTPSHLC